MDFLTIPEYIITREGLTTTEALVLAVINTFSQSEQGVYYGSRAYLQKWAKATLRTINYALASLEEKGLIIKGEIYDGNVRRCTYKIDPCKICTPAEIAPLPLQNLPNTPAKIALHNNTIDNTSNSTLLPTTTRTREEMIAEATAEFDSQLAKYAGKYTPQMMDSFRDHWLAPLQRPTKAQVKAGIFLKYQTQETWSMGGRLATWNARDIQWAAERAARCGARGYTPHVNAMGETAQVEAFRKSKEALSRAALMERQQALAIEEGAR